MRATLGPNEGARILAAGGLILLPTETVWGLACGLASAEALFRLKGRDASKPVALAFPGVQAAFSSGLVRVGIQARALANRFWPGPLTLVLPAASQEAPPWILGAEGGMGLRVPDHEEALQTLEAFGGPVLLSSANPSGVAVKAGVFPDDLFPEVPLVATPRLPGATASTVVSLLGQAPRVLREGVISGEEILRCLAS